MVSGRTGSICFGILALFWPIAAAPQVPGTYPKATEKVVQQYEKFVAEGALLTPEGWAKASKLFDKPGPYPRDAVIFLMSTGGAIGETWVKGDHAEAQTKWTDALGTIDRTLRYKPPECTDCTMSTFIYHLVRRSNAGGEWRMDYSLDSRMATPDKALAYVIRMRDQSTDPAIRKNAEKTIAILKRLTGRCGRDSAC